MKPINKNIPKVEIKAIFFLLIFEFLFNLLPLNNRAVFFPCKTVGYAHINEVCNFFASRRHFGSRNVFV